MVPSRVTAVLTCLIVCLPLAPPAIADPVTDAPPPDAAATAQQAGPPPDDGLIASAEPATTTTPDGWTLKISSRDEAVMPVHPLTTALSSRDYIVGGIFSGSLTGGEAPGGVFEVGYQIGCGIDMSTSNGVTLTGTAGMTGTVGVSGPLGTLPTGILPALSVPVVGGVAIGLKPGIVNIIPVDKKEFKGAEPWIMISNFHVKIDGCVGQSFIRSYATLTHQTEMSDAVLSWLGNTKTV
jgi:hypothetical protein